MKRKGKRELIETTKGKKEKEERKEDRKVEEENKEKAISKDFNYIWSHLSAPLHISSHQATDTISQ